MNSPDFMFHLGSDSNVHNGELNDPTRPTITTEDVSSYPIYISKPGNLSNDGDDAWHVERVDVIVNPGPGQMVFSRLAGASGARGNIWLRNESGHILHLKP